MIKSAVFILSSTSPTLPGGGGGGELMRGIKIPLQDFALKMQGGLCARGGIFEGHYGKCISI